MGTTIHVPSWAADMLGAVIVDANTMRLPVQLEPDRFAVINDIARRLGARYDRGAALFVWPKSANVERMLRDTLRKAAVGAPPHPDNPPDRWATPPELAEQVMHLAARREYDSEGLEELVHNGVSLLDMCAGTGHLTGPALAYGFKTYAVEEDDNCVAYLTEKMPGIRTLWHMSPAEWIGEFAPYTKERFDDDGDPLPKLGFQAIVCHASHLELQDVVLTRALWPFLKPGGRLVTVVSGDSWGGPHIRSANFRAWCDAVNADVWEANQWLDTDYGELNKSVVFAGVMPEDELGDEPEGEGGDDGE